MPITNDHLTLIDVDINLEVAILDRLDPGVKNTQTRYLENAISNLSVQYFSAALKLSHDQNLKIDKTVKQHINIDDVGFPNPTIVKSAIKKLSKHAVLKGPYVQLTTNIRIEGDPIGQKDILLRIQPNIEFIIKVFGNNGKLISKSNTTSVLDNFITSEELNKNGFNKSNKENIDSLVLQLNELLRKGITRATNKLKL